jgi:hypothetical protein
VIATSILARGGLVGVGVERADLVVERRADAGQRREDERELGHALAEDGVAGLQELLQRLARCRPPAARCPRLVRGLRSGRPRNAHRGADGKQVGAQLVDIGEQMRPETVADDVVWSGATVPIACC